jgi:hypothetical protein
MLWGRRRDSAVGSSLRSTPIDGAPYAEAPRGISDNQNRASIEEKAKTQVLANPALVSDDLPKNDPR